MKKRISVIMFFALAFAGISSAEVREYGEYYYEGDHSTNNDSSGDGSFSEDIYSDYEYGNEIQELQDDKGFLFEAGVGGSSSWFLIPKVYADALLVYRADDALGLGVGGKIYITDTDSFEGNAEYIIPYAVYRASLGNLKLSAKAGALITYEKVKEKVAVSPYFNASCGFPVWKLGHGKFGFELGLEYLMIPYDMFDSRDEEFYKWDNQTERALNNLQIFGGIKYFLPL